MIPPKKKKKKKTTTTKNNNNKQTNKQTNLRVVGMQVTSRQYPDNFAHSDKRG